jgi:hypothetical protein
LSFFSRQPRRRPCPEIKLAWDFGAKNRTSGQG